MKPALSGLSAFHYASTAAGRQIEMHISNEQNMKVAFRLNGKPAAVDAPAEMPLLWVLRDILDLKGAKFGCGLGQCGACTVHVNGMPIRSCIWPISATAGVDVLTIEGLSPSGTHPLQRAWEELDVPQCGYCQAGQIMSAAALLAKTPKPTDEQIDSAMQGNVCRCGTYLRIRQAIKRASASRRADADGPATESNRAHEPVDR
ncbi:MAG TPA: (2Fe-2S)-binding protein [Gemmatimonadaceae bacterium]